MTGYLLEQDTNRHLRQHCTIFEQCCLNKLFELLPFEKNFFAKHT